MARDESDNIGVGALQRVVDELSHIVSSLGHFVGTNNQGMTTAAKAISVASTAWSGGSIAWTPGSNWSQGKPNGGGGGFTQTRNGGLMAAGRLGTLAVNPRNAGAGGGGMSSLPNGGGGSFSGGPPRGPSGSGGGSSVSMGFGGLKESIQGGWNNAVNFGNQHMSSQMMMDTYATWGSNRYLNGGVSGNRAQLLYNAQGYAGQNTNRMALSTGDALAGEMARMRISGTASVSNPMGRATYGNMGVLGMSNPTLGMVGSANVQQNLLTPQTFWRAQQMGLGSIRGQGGTPISITDLSSRMFRANFGNGSFSRDRLNGSLTPGGNMNTRLSMLFGGDQRAIEAMGNEMTMQKKAQDAGISGSQFGTLMNQAGRKGPQSQAAIARLKAAGIDTNSMLQSQKTLEGTKRSMEGDYNEQFANSMKKATHYVDQFNQVLDKIVQNPLVKKMLGGMGGISALNSGMSDAKGYLGMLNPVTGLAGILAGGGGGGLMSGLGGIGNEIGNVLGNMTGGRTMMRSVGTQGSTAQISSSGSNGSATSRSNASTAGTPGGGLTWQRALNIAQTKAGTPYVYGAEGPNAFDCSGLWFWVMHQMGMKNVGRTVSDIDGMPGQKIPVNEAQPGDFLVESGSGTRAHIEMYLGGGKTFGAHHTGTKIGVVPKSSIYDHAKRIFGSGSGSATFGNSDPGGGGQNNSSPGGDLGNIGGGSVSVEEIDAIMSSLGRGGGGMASGGSTGSTTNGTSASPAGNTNVAGGGRTPDSARALAKAMMPQWSTGAEWAAWDKLMMSESGWNYKAGSPGRAYGIPQALPGNKMASMGADWLTNPVTQIKWMDKYIQGRYKDPIGAWNHKLATRNDKFHNAGGWYDKGAWEIQQDENARIHKGEMVIPAKQADTIRDALLKESLYGSTPNRQSGSGKRSGSGGATLTFNQGSVVINVQGALTEDSARRAATAFAQQLAKETIYDQIAAGVN